MGGARIWEVAAWRRRWADSAAPAVPLPVRRPCRPDNAADPRRSAAESVLHNLGPALAKSEMGLFGVLSSFPVHNPHTAYTAMMSPAAGTMAAFVRTSMCPETPGDAVIDSRYCQR